MIVCFPVSRYMVDERGYFKVSEGECDIIVESTLTEELVRSAGRAKIEICEKDEITCLNDIRRKIYKITKSCKFA
ncbi:hypothetical protein [Sulfuracidifex metallicus]|uniref:Uncharacterized protein n=1 Tax=Sulfuracidifex metallicus DSM 6482 = JCM 9184 TaxID=523847 RepID=A0A6A9QLZ6_SULME|nr:hypothetical protein [Sulfuracidifex metallicus]MUN29179.1 hypothetical protein [Sulfuracidifex metallicus DSM 6482 = JCM 9184]WOE50300.1 hypothetical protein RQ359_001821 [Sulfuracidifex metallicus DSM 6482 = JCM 9184]